MFNVKKVYPHSLGLSCCFRQWRAESHCHFLHGYALQFEFFFDSYELDQNGWVVDFGALKPLKQWLQDNYDHKTLIARDDPHLQTFQDLHNNGLIDLRILEDGVGLERFALEAYNAANEIVGDVTQGRAGCVFVRIAEHEGNSAIYRLEPTKGKPNIEYRILETKDDASSTESTGSSSTGDPNQESPSGS